MVKWRCWEGWFVVEGVVENGFDGFLVVVEGWWIVWCGVCGISVRCVGVMKCVCVVVRVWGWCYKGVLGLVWEEGNKVE